jgi:hypothetical protein
VRIDLPEIGQLVEVRRRQWVVMDVKQSAVAGNGFRGNACCADKSYCG